MRDRTATGGALVRVVALAAAAALAASALVVAQPATSSAQAPPADFVIQGGGWGHGLGMSQHGARGRAEAGHGYGEILGFYYPGATLTAAGHETVRVALGGEVGSVAITGNGTGVPFTPHGSPSPVLVAAPGQTVQVAATGGQFTITPGAGAFTGVGGTLAAPIPPGSTVTVGTTGIRYARGTLVFQLLTANTMQVSVHLPMEEYLDGIAEVPFGWHPEALKAQVVAARSYALNVIQRRRAHGAPYDVVATTGDQVYSGYETEVRPRFANWSAAVDATAGQVLTYDGGVVQAFYSSSNGGWTERSGYVFATDLPYLAAVPDEFDSGGGNPRHRWSKAVSNADFRAAVRARTGVDVGDVTTYAIGGPRGGSGRIDKAPVQITGTLGSATVSGAAFKSMLGLNSTLVFDGSGPPFGSLDVLQLHPGGFVHARGWGIDPNTTQALPIALVVDGVWIETITAGGSRPDVEAAHPGWGPDHGFDKVAWAPGGVHNVCLVALNLGPGTDTVLGCRWLQVLPPGPPIGNIDAWATEPGAAAIAGWAIDPDVGGPVEIHVSLDGGARWEVTRTGTGRPRPDVGAAFPGFGDERGWDLKFPLGPGDHSACVFAVNQGEGSHGLLGCVTLSVPA